MLRVAAWAGARFIGPRRRRALAVTGFALFALLLGILAFSRESAADVVGLRDRDLDALRRTKAVTRKFKFSNDGVLYLAAISYQVMRVPPEKMFELLERVSTTLPHLPATYRAERVASPDEYARVQMIHGNAWLQGGYTVVWEPSPSLHQIRFWMDPEKPHDVEDIWGYFRATPYESGRSLFTVAVAVAPGAAYRGPLWENKIHTSLLKSARYLRKYVDSLVASGSTRR